MGSSWCTAVNDRESQPKRGRPLQQISCVEDPFDLDLLITDALRFALITIQK